MRPKLFLLLVVCLVCLFSANAQTLNEKETSVVLNETAADLALVVENPSRAFEAPVEIELLDAESKVRARVSQPVRLKEGKDTYHIAMPLGDLLKTAENEIAWYRLRYRVGDARGIISLSQILRDIFELRVIATDNLLTGMTYRSRIRAINPFTGAPVAGVKIDAVVSLDLDDGNDDNDDDDEDDDAKKLKLTSGGETDTDGFTNLDFQIPVEVTLGDDGEIKITGKKNGIVRDATDNLMIAGQDSRFLMMTDKPIYQPDQTFNIRGILLKGGESTVVSGQVDVEFTIEDEDDTVLYRETVKTSNFGIAAISWPIPESAKLGTYRVRVSGPGNDSLGYQSFKVSRYDLPNFTVNAKATKPYYLPNEKQAEVEVRADYLFGKPVLKGKVRVVQETGREWNYKEQKYDLKEGEPREGETDAGGRFLAKFDLTEAHAEIEDDDDDKFDDLHFTAYFTDLTTNRTEQRRFDVRVTREPIHVYLIGERYGQNPDLPVTGYVSTFYADGTPAVCDVEVSGSEEYEDEFKTFQKLKTSSLGAGRVKFTRPKYEDEDADVDLKIVAKDRFGNKGTYSEEVNFDDDTALKVQTVKTIHKPGDSITVKLLSTRKTGGAYIDVVQGWSVIDSYFVNLENGRAEIKIPYQPNFRGQLTVAAFMEDEEDENEIVRASRGIIFPSPQNVRLDASFEKDTYKPGEEATVKFGVTDSVGQAVESALAVVVFDRAVEERAKSEDSFRGVFKNFEGFLGYGGSFGSINIKDINEMDLTKPITDDMQLVAEAILHNSYYYPNIFHSRRYQADAKSVYAAYFKTQFTPIENALNLAYKSPSSRHPQDAASLQKILAEGRVSLDVLRDPWEQAYRAVFDVEKTQDIVRFVSAGADKTFDTDDDLTVSSLGFTYFTPTAKAIDKAIEDHHKRTGGYIRDQATLFQELGVTELNDRFGRPYRIFFEVSKRVFAVRINSLGKDGVASPYTWQGDDFDVWTSRIDYFADTEAKVLAILQAAKTFPRDETEFKTVLRAGDVDFEELRDGYGEKLYVIKHQASRYADKTTTETFSRYGDDKTVERKVITPVTQEVITFQIRGKGADKQENTYDDFTLAQFEHVLTEQTKDDPVPKPVFSNIAFTGGTGSIRGLVTDANGAVVPNASVTATNEETSQTWSVNTDSDGNYLIANLPMGSYAVKAFASGFKSAVRQGVPVKANTTTTINIVLEAGGISETVSVTVAASAEETSTTAQISSLPINGRRAQNFQLLVEKPEAKTSEPNSTPRLREYFPETLVWSPELITDSKGKAELKFKLADNITTWKLYTIASTKKGKIGVAEKEITAFQPFFVDLDPPKFLTNGDEISLPVQVRNYTEKKQKVDIGMAKADWFSFLGQEKQQVDVNSGDSQNAVFGFKAIESIKDGKQRVTAIAQGDSDAIEKPVTVSPDGEEIVKTETSFFKESTAFDVNFPANALARTQKAELKVYPNLFSHVAESVEGLLQRPYGCGEQTISSTYPNLMILKFTKDDNKLRRAAQKNLWKGYERLTGYQVADGGFTYWGGKDTSDVALTAYALRFLNDAQDFVEVDEDVIAKARDWLTKQQRTDGSWTKKYYNETKEDLGRTKLFTSYVARTLAGMKEKDTAALQKALGYLKIRNAEIDEPYALALYGLASLDAGNTAEAGEIAAQLEKMAIAEGNSVYWKLETNTPFYGWGTAGRLETTALVLQLLLREGKPDAARSVLIAKGTHFLLKNKDRYGVWYSTQTTINVLDTFLATLAPGNTNRTTAETIQVMVNGAVVQSLSVPGSQIAPLSVDLQPAPGPNRVEVKSSGTGSIMAQVVQTHYIDWRDSESASRTVNQSRALRLDYKCDKTSAAIMQDISCSVEAERIGFQGYGMLLAEIGTPPGADVSRESLQAAMDVDWSLSRYDVLPDRIVIYMWSKAGGTKFNFKFRPRYGINAQTPASTIYDYYNPDARATAIPMRFIVKN